MKTFTVGKEKMTKKEVARKHPVRWAIGQAIKWSIKNNYVATLIAISTIFSFIFAAKF